MASFINKMNRLRNFRLHVTNDFIYPSASLYHEIVQGIPWTGGFSDEKPMRVDTKGDKLLKYVMERRPNYKDYPWAPTEVEDVCIYFPYCRQY